MNYFKDLQDSGSYDSSDKVQVEALKFRFYGCLQSDLDETIEFWNNHRIRNSQNAHGPHNRPNIMYELPSNFNFVDHKLDVDTNDLILVQSSFYKSPSQFSEK